MTAADLLKLGLDGLRALQTERGFNASDAESGWYPGLYGRDSLWVLLLLLEAAAIRADPEVDALTEQAGPAILTTLAGLQGTRRDDLVEEQPGRIPHEYHPRPTAHAIAMGLPLSDGKSYAGFDETFLFIIACRAFAAAYPGHQVSQRLRPSVERAVAWIDAYADPDGDGLFEYARRHPANLLNQVWKDSFDSATHTGFDVPPQPLAWLEVQAYAYAVLRGLADDGDQRAGRRADSLAALVDSRFWLGPADGYAMALDGAKRPVRVVSSNPGHALWAGLVPPERAGPLIARLLRPDMLSGYGLRTLSRDSPFYAPFAYHRGNIWPFDNAIFVLGLLRHGRDAEAVRVARSVGDALTRAGSPVECYAVLEPDDDTWPPVTGPLLWLPRRNRVQAFSAAALVVFGSLLARGR